MITINIVCVGNLKEKFWKEACEEYQKRLSRFCKLNIIELAEQNNLGNDIKTLEKEGEDILKHISGKTMLLAIEGKQLSSEEFADKIEKETLTTSELTFVIGSSCGVSEKVKSGIKEKISFGKATFPHNLARVMLLEQIYRAFMIKNGSTYHK